MSSICKTRNNLGETESFSVAATNTGGGGSAGTTGFGGSGCRDGTNSSADTKIGASALSPPTETEEFAGAYKYTLYIVIKIKTK
jgi:hypothetical protein